MENQPFLSYPSLNLSLFKTLSFPFHNIYLIILSSILSSTHLHRLSFSLLLLLFSLQHTNTHPHLSSYNLVLMDSVNSTEHLCYVRCTYCNTVLAVGVPCKRLMDTVTVKCGHCNHLSFLSPRSLLLHSLSSSSDHHHFPFQGTCSDCRKSSQLPQSSSSTSPDQVIPNAPFVVKPPEKKHRLPSAYNRFMKEEIQRIKAEKPNIPHREAFSMAAKNWAKCDPRASNIASSSVKERSESANGFIIESFSTLK
ncbi:putative transcription factor C2C2-YABBY family [Dioscorea sansibarensis]